ncbi:ribonuclease H-like domain-containing protein [Tanacetum coccineum]|uniref:Ribonuclease H-like domain-containing protein n=1 Tax=Tanacetum coccineum TaxID=301880 RepID=A0ABQ5B378_9ASTR
MARSVATRLVLWQMAVPIHQLDVKNAFLHRDLSETVYMHQPLGFRDSVHPDYGIDTIYLLLYVDDIVLTASSEGLLQRIIGSLHQEFAMTDLGPLNYFLGISVTRDSSGFLQYLTFTKPDISYALFSSSTTYLVAYSDVDWASCPTTRRSTLGYCVFFGNNLLSWSAKRQPTLSRSSAEAEYHGVANAVAETCWLRNLLQGCFELMKDKLGPVLHIVLGGLRGPEQVVRGASSFALGQFAEYLQPEITSHYETVLPSILNALEDLSDDVKVYTKLIDSGQISHFLVPTDTPQDVVALSFWGR